MEGLIRNQPDIKTNTLTATMLNSSNNTLKIDIIGEDTKSSFPGAPNAIKSACRTNTINMAMILNNSILESLTTEFDILFFNSVIQLNDSCFLKDITNSFIFHYHEILTTHTQTKAIKDNINARTANILQQSHSLLLDSAYLLSRIPLIFKSYKAL